MLLDLSLSAFLWEGQNEQSRRQKACFSLKAMENSNKMKNQEQSKSCGYENNSSDTNAPNSCLAGSNLLNLEKTQLELYKLEYEQLALRYENIYKAVWQNFSYMSALAAGFLVFVGRSKDSFPLELVIFTALSPLVFWYCATFVPMNFYGDQAVKRLSEIEKHINKIVFSDDETNGLQHFQAFEQRRDDEKSPCRNGEKYQMFPLLCKVLRALNKLFELIYRSVIFYEDNSGNEPNPKPPWSVRDVVHFVAFIITLTWGVSLIWFIWGEWGLKFLILEGKEPIVEFLQFA